MFCQIKALTVSIYADGCLKKIEEEKPYISSGFTCQWQPNGFIYLFFLTNVWPSSLKS